MRLFNRELSPFPKAIVILSAILLVSAGICGINGSIETHLGWSFFGPRPNSLFANVIVAMDVLAFACFYLAAAGLVLTLVLWPVVALYRRASPDPDLPTVIPFETTPPDSAARNDQQGEP